jgi:CBS domain-containing protein
VHIVGSGKAVKKSDVTIVAMENTDMSSLINRISSSDIMTPNPTTIISKDRVSSAKGIMVRHRIDHLPVVEKQQRGVPTLVGMITSGHIMQSGYS